MMIIRETKAEDFEQIYPLLCEFQNPYLQKKQWKRLFEDLWGTSPGYCGYGMFDKDRAVGFLGLLFSERVIRNKLHRICHLTSWIVLPEYRGRSIFLLQPVLRLPNVTLVDLTPSREVYALLKRAGFQDLETHMRFLFPFWRFSKIQIQKEAMPEPALQKVVSDHIALGCFYLKVQTPSGACDLLLHRVIRRKAPFRVAYVLYAHPWQIFQREASGLCKTVCKHLHVWALVVDERFLNHIPIPFSVQRKLAWPRVFRSNSLSPLDIDALYSEFPVLNI
ncbi:MAG: hypothetical protein HXY29_14320 [Rhodocyclaceae bacterium]|nr:hypothetical protein [Rhodocyclaceae bacterium]